MKPFYLYLSLAIVSIFVWLWLSQRAKSKDLKTENTGLRNLLQENQIPIPNFRPVAKIKH